MARRTEARAMFFSWTSWFLALAAGLASAQPAFAGARWVLVYYRQLGTHENANARTIESHLFRENGAKGANIGVTNKWNPGFALFGNADIDGWHRINPLDTAHCAYDIRIYDPGVPTDQTPDFYFQNPPINKFYSYLTHWMYVADDSRVTAYPAMPVYHYDLVDGINQVSGLNPSNCTATTFTEPSGADSDAKVLPADGWAPYQAQTFVVPAGINRIVSAQAFVTRQGGVKFFYRATIRQGGPTGPQVGGAAISREVFSTQFKEVAVNWPLEGATSVPVTPGQTYALHVEPTDGGGFNAYATTANNYPNGSMYQGTLHRPNQDLFAVVVGVGYDVTPPTINRSPDSFTPTAAKRTNPPSDNLTIANSGGGTLSYTLSSNATWLGTNPTSGVSTGQPDNIAIVYNTDGLNTGEYAGVITIDAPGAANTPQTVTVNLTVTPPPFAPVDFDQDGDVDQEDFGYFQRCMSGPGVTPPPGCQNADLDGDDDVDQADFMIFYEKCYSGPTVPANPICDE